LIAVSIDLGCSQTPNDADKKVIFAADHEGGTEVNVNWKSFDTLEIIYSDRLEPRIKIEKVTFDDSRLNVSIEYSVTNK